MGGINPIDRRLIFRQSGDRQEAGSISQMFEASVKAVGHYASHSSSSTSPIPMQAFDHQYKGRTLAG